MRLPEPRGTVTEALVAHLLGRPGAARRLDRAVAARQPDDALCDEDLQLGLYIAYELAYRGFDDVDDEAEWDPAVLGMRRALEQAFLRGLADAARVPDDEEPVEVQVAALVAADGAPSVSAYLRRRGTLDEYRELAVHRSVYQLKEADPHSWGIPRLSGRAKAALVEIQCDEYGGGRLERMHATLFARTMRELGLDDTYGAYVDRVPATTLATSNVISLFGLNRRWRGALVGHLAAFEMTSSIPAARLAAGLRRLGAGSDATEFYDEHVEADAVHEQLAAVDLCGGLVADEPGLLGDVVFGAAACLAVEGRFGQHLLSSWQDGRTSLRASVADALVEHCA